MADVLLTYGWVRSSYSAMRNLAGHEISVLATDSNTFGMCQMSRLKAGFRKYQSHYVDEQRFIEDVRRLCDEYGVSLLFPSHNETEVLARHRTKFDERVAALLPKSELCEIFNNKAKAYDLAKSLGVPVPLRIEYQNPDIIADLIAEAGLSRTVIKLLTGNSAKGVFYAESGVEAQAIVLHLIDEYSLSSERYPQIEEYVEGEGWGSSVLYWGGELVAGFSHRRLKEKLSTGGTSTLRESASHMAMELATRKLFDHVAWHGLAMAEYKVCPRTGRFWFIEVNPRMWGSIPLAISAGVEFPYLAWLCAKEGAGAALAYHATKEVVPGWRGRWLLGDALVAARELVTLSPAQAFNSLFKTKSNSLDDFYWDDLGAFAGEVLYYLFNSARTLSLNPSEKGMIG